MHKVTLARNEIGPLLDRLIAELEAEGSATQKAYFKRIRSHLYGADNDFEVATPIIELSTSTAMGFRFSSTADALIERILSKAQVLVEELQGIEPPIH